MKTLCYIKLFFLLTTLSFAQNFYYVKGLISDKKTSRPIKNVKVSLYNYKDSLIKMTVSDKKGFYFLSTDGQEDYYIIADKENYFKKKMTGISSNSSVDKGNITMSKKAHHSHFSIPQSKNYRLRAGASKAIQKNGKTSWVVKTTLTNRSRDTLFYFSSACSESIYYMIDQITLHVNGQKCDLDEQTVIAIPPRGKRKVELEISSYEPLTSPVEFRLLLIMFKAKDLNERIPPTELSQRTKGGIIVTSNKIKT
jgi:hypothetical protein